MLFSTTIQNKLYFFDCQFIVHRAMASIIKTLLQTHKAEIQGQDAWRETSKVKSIQRERCRRFGDQFLEIIIQLIADEEEMQGLTPVKLAKIRSLLLNKITLKHNSQENVVERALGLFIRDSFQKYDQFRKIKQELEMFYEDIDLDISQIIQDYQDEQTIQDTIYSSRYPSSVRGAPSMESDFSFIDKWDSEIVISKDKHQQIILYLKKLSSPASELTYLCQQYGWKNNYESCQTNESQFETTAIVLLQYKNLKKELRESAVGQNKKISRMFASAKMLKKIYLSFPRLWESFCLIKKAKGIQIPSTDISTSIINSSKIFQQKVEVLNVNIPTTATSETELEGYLKQISSFKSELNLLIQQLPNYFSPPTMKKEQVNNRWKVTGTINFRAEKGLPIKYEQTDINLNSKAGEQMVAKKIVTAVYKDNSEIFETMSMIKNKKGIKT